MVTKTPKMTKLSYEKTDEELEALVKSDVQAFLKNQSYRTSKAIEAIPNVSLLKVDASGTGYAKMRSFPLVKNQRRHYHTTSVLSQKQSRRTKGNRSLGKSLHSSVNKCSNQCHH